MKLWIMHIGIVILMVADIDVMTMNIKNITINHLNGDRVMNEGKNLISSYLNRRSEK